MSDNDAPPLFTSDDLGFEKASGWIIRTTPSTSSAPILRGRVEDAGEIFDDNDEGGYGRVYFIELNEPLRVTVEKQMRDGSIHNKEMMFKKVAVKRLKANNVKSGKAPLDESRQSQRILREYIAANRLKHENIVHLLGFWNEFSYRSRSGAAAVPALIFPVAEDGDLSSYLMRHPDTAKSRRLEFISQIASALEFAHSQNVRHGDLKANNVLVIDGQAVLADFGLAGFAWTSGLTTEPRGNQRYLAPEVLRLMEGTAVIHKYKPTEKSDMFSFGMLNFEILTGSCPWSRLSDYGVSALRSRDYSAIPDQPNDTGMSNEHWEFLKSFWQEENKRPSAKEALSLVEDLKTKEALRLVKDSAKD